LKKENKMTWEPKNKLDDEDVEVSDDDDKEGGSGGGGHDHDKHHGKAKRKVSQKKKMFETFLGEAERNIAFKLRRQRLRRLRRRDLKAWEGNKEWPH
jgi:hypothetical protein